MLQTMQLFRLSRLSRDLESINILSHAMNAVSAHVVIEKCVVLVSVHFSTCMCTCVSVV